MPGEAAIKRPVGGGGLTVKGWGVDGLVEFAGCGMARWRLLDVG